MDKGLLDRLTPSCATAISPAFPTPRRWKSSKNSGENFEYPRLTGACDLQTEHERYLTEKHLQAARYSCTDYPKEIKAFYMRQNDDGKTVAAADLLVPGVGEIIGGSQREERLRRAGGAHCRSWA